MKRKLTGADVMRAVGNIDGRWIDLAYGEAEREAAAGKRSRRRGGLIGAECRKLLGARVVWVFLAVFLALNFFLAWQAAGETFAARCPAGTVGKFFEGYFEDPEEYEAWYREITAYETEQRVLSYEAERAGEEPYEWKRLPNRYSDDDAISDSLLFRLLYTAINQSGGYSARLEHVTNEARANLREYRRVGVGEDTFIWKYQEEVVRRYEALRGTVRIAVEYVHGWDGYFEYRIGEALLFFMLILVGSVVFTQEKQTGFLPVLRTARRGRARTAAVKIAVTVGVSALFTLLFAGTAFAAFGLRVGFSSPYNALQALPAFTYSPYRITVGTYMILTVLVRMLAAAVFSVLVLVLSNLLRHPVLSYPAGLALFGVNLLLSRLDAAYAAAHCNLVSAAAVNSLFERYRALDLFGAAAGTVPVTLVLLAVLLLGGAAAAVLLHALGGTERRVGFLDPAVSAVMTAWARLRAAAARQRRGTRRTERTYSLSLFRAETFKTLVSSRFLVLLLALLASKGWYSARQNEAKPSYADAVYKEYMTVLEGPLTEEKSAWIAAERARIDGILEIKDAMQEAYAREEVGYEEYRDYLTEYGDAEARSAVLSPVERHAAYLAARGDGWFVYDAGWRRLFSGDADLFLYTAVLLLLTGTFAGEYVSRASAGSFAQILRVTKRGRRETFRAKLVSGGTIAVLLAAFSCAVDFTVIARNYDLPAAGAPLASISLFGEYAGSLSLTGYAAVYVILRVLGALIMAMLVCALSELLSRHLPVLGSAAALTLCPALFAAFGWRAAQRVNFLSLLAGTPLFLDSARLSLLGSGWTMLALWIVLAGIAVSALTWSARKMYVE